MRIFVAVSNTFFPVYFQRYARCSAGISFLPPCFRKEISMCSMKLEYLVNGKVTAYLEASKYSAAREDATGFVAPAPRSYFFPSLLPLIHTLSRIIIRSSRLSMLLSRVAFHSFASHLAYFHLYHTRYSIPLNYSCSHFLALSSFIFSIASLYTCWRMIR